MEVEVEVEVDFNLIYFKLIRRRWSPIYLSRGGGEEGVRARHSWPGISLGE